MSMTHKVSAAAVLAVLLSALHLPFTYAQEPQEPQEAADNAESDPVWEAASAAMLNGPQTIALRDQARLLLPEGYSFVPEKEAIAVMERMGNQTDSRFLGLILPGFDASWLVTVEYENAGYIKDDDAKEWDADDLLTSLKEGTEAANQRRVDMGIAPIEVTRWVESPTYDSSTQRLVWSAEAREKGGNDPDPTINYNTYVLGREGYISLNLITSASEIELHKPAARTLLGAVEYNDGKRYDDFNESTDKVAAYGLAALVGGIAAKKLGLLATLGVLLVKFGKVILIGILAGAGVLAKFFTRRNAEPQQ